MMYNNNKYCDYIITTNISVIQESVFLVIRYDV